jgi:hypothetical protein
MSATYYSHDAKYDALSDPVAPKAKESHVEIEKKQSPRYDDPVYDQAYDEVTDAEYDKILDEKEAQFKTTIDALSEARDAMQDGINKLTDAQRADFEQGKSIKPKQDLDSDSDSSSDGEEEIIATNAAGAKKIIAANTQKILKRYPDLKLDNSNQHAIKEFAELMLVIKEIKAERQLYESDMSLVMTSLTIEKDELKKKIDTLTVTEKDQFKKHLMEVNHQLKRQLETQSDQYHTLRTVSEQWRQPVVSPPSVEQASDDDTPVMMPLSLRVNACIEGDNEPLGAFSAIEATFPGEASFAMAILKRARAYHQLFIKLRGKTLKKNGMIIQKNIQITNLTRLLRSARADRNRKRVLDEKRAAIIQSTETPSNQ